MDMDKHEWKPIETAPKEKRRGIRILVCREGGGSTIIDRVLWNDRIEKWKYPYLATHWMSLPEPLKISQG